jgi:hypothetical protein
MSGDTAPAYSIGRSHRVNIINSTSYTPPPGSYNLPINKTAAVSIGKSPRPEFVSPSVTPGPAKYTVKLPTHLPNIKLGGKEREQTTRVTPGPGDYKIDFTSHTLNITMGNRTMNVDSLLDDKSDSPGPGMYDLSIESISPKVS